MSEISILVISNLRGRPYMEYLPMLSFMEESKFQYMKNNIFQEVYKYILNNFANCSLPSDCFA